ncbi:hypothetical protein [Pseudomonas putida]|uniref:hypothetical protein n=1 Tax=Pseudomonas putida TaxID=303 RepID=UPI003D99E311
MAITGQGWELLVQRESVQKSGGKKRTYGRYQVFLDGAEVAELSGNMCESPGPGDNKRANNGKRIEPGRYPIWTQFGRYRSIGYSQNLSVPGDAPMPAILIAATEKRTGILIHPGHPPTLYLSSTGCFNPTSPLTADQTMEYFDSRRRVVDLIESLRQFAPDAFKHEVMSRIQGAYLVVEGEPAESVAAPPARRVGAALAIAEPASLPLSKKAALACADWLMTNFGEQLKAAVRAKPYKTEHLCAIVCQETAFKWLKWTDTHTSETIIERCVFDASGDFPGSPRGAFPKNTAEFEARYGADLTNMLIEEANKSRRLQGWGDKPWVYKGYGIFQYDLQHIKNAPDFFREKQWYDFSICLNRACMELDEKLVASGGELWGAIRRYNGQGKAAEQYASNVKVFTAYCKEVTG